MGRSGFWIWGDPVQISSLLLQGVAAQYQDQCPRMHMRKVHPWVGCVINRAAGNTTQPAGPRGSPWVTDSTYAASWRCCSGGCAQPVARLRNTAGRCGPIYVMYDIYVRYIPVCYMLFTVGPLPPCLLPYTQQTPLSSTVRSMPGVSTHHLHGDAFWDERVGQVGEAIHHDAHRGEELGDERFGTWHDPGVLQEHGSGNRFFLSKTQRVEQEVVPTLRSESKRLLRPART